MSEDTKSKMLDLRGNHLAVGDMCAFHLEQQKTGILLAKIVEIREGGMVIPMAKGQQGLSPAQVRVILDITLTADPRMPIFPVLVKTVNPQEAENVEKILEAAGQSPGPKLVD